MKGGLGLRIFAAAILLLGAVAPAAALDASRLAAAVEGEEQTLHARVGVAVIDRKDGARWAYRGDERFPLMSTHKSFSCAALLAKVDRGWASLDARVVIQPAELVANSPVTSKRVAPASMSLAEICAAAIDYSDNTAANKILAAIGGPGGVTSLFRALGDETSRLDRTETSLNEALPGDPRDTTTPKAAAADLEKVLLGDVLKPDSRGTLTQWMVDDKVSGALLRAALPAQWRIADKTGAGERGSRGIVAVIWPTGRAPVVTAIYIAETEANLDARNAAIARIGAALKAAIAP